MRVVLCKAEGEILAGVLFDDEQPVEEALEAGEHLVADVPITGRETQAVVDTLRAFGNLCPNFLLGLDVIFGKVANAAFARGGADGAVDMADATLGRKS